MALRSPPRLEWRPDAQSCLAGVEARRATGFCWLLAAPRYGLITTKAYFEPSLNAPLEYRAVVALGRAIEPE